MDCISKISRFCIGTGHPAWGGMCSNCADDSRPKQKKSALVVDDEWREGLKEVSNWESQTGDS